MYSGKISIIIPVLNESTTILELVNYLLADKSDRIAEIIIVNAKKSDDNIASITFPSSVRLLNAAVSGRAKQMQLGAKESVGEILFFLHADTIPPNGYGELIINCLSRVDFGMFSYKFDTKKWNLAFNGWMTKWKGFYTGGGDQGLFLTKKIFDKVGGFDVNLNIMEDYDLFWRLVKERYRYKIIKKPAQVSARKYKKNNALKVNLVNLITLLGFKYNRNGEKWEKFYRKYIS